MEQSSDHVILFQGSMTLQQTGDIPICVIVIEHLTNEVHCIEVAARISTIHESIEAPRIFVSPEKLYSKINKNEVRIRLNMKLQEIADKKRAEQEEQFQPDVEESYQLEPSADELYTKYTRELAVKYIFNRLELVEYNTSKKVFRLTIKAKGLHETISIGSYGNKKRVCDVLVKKPPGLETQITWHNSSVFVHDDDPLLNMKGIARISSDDYPRGDTNTTATAALPSAEDTSKSSDAEDKAPRMLSELVTKAFREAAASFRGRAVYAKEERESHVPSRRHWFTAVRRIVRQMYVKETSNRIHAVQQESAEQEQLAVSSRYSSSQASAQASENEDGDTVADDLPVQPRLPGRKKTGARTKTSFLLCAVPHGSIVPTLDKDDLVTISTRIIYRPGVHDIGRTTSSGKIEVAASYDYDSIAEDTSAASNLDTLCHEPATSAHTVQSSNSFSTSASISHTYTEGGAAECNDKRPHRDSIILKALDEAKGPLATLRKTISAVIATNLMRRAGEIEQAEAESNLNLADDDDHPHLITQKAKSSAILSAVARAEQTVGFGIKNSAQFVSLPTSENMPSVMKTSLRSNEKSMTASNSSSSTCTAGTSSPTQRVVNSKRAAGAGDIDSKSASKEQPQHYSQVRLQRSSDQGEMSQSTGHGGQGGQGDQGGSPHMRRNKSSEPTNGNGAGASVYKKAALDTGLGDRNSLRGGGDKRNKSSADRGTHGAQVGGTSTNSGNSRGDSRPIAACYNSDSESFHNDEYLGSQPSLRLVSSEDKASCFCEVPTEAICAELDGSNSTKGSG